MLQSQATGRFYATAKRCSITSTFDLETAKSLIGQQIPGTIVRVDCATYDYTVKETGEAVKLAHTYAYVPHEGAAPQYEPQRQRFTMETT
jgi:phage-related protein